MFLWQVGGNGGQSRKPGRRVEGYRQYHHREIAILAGTVMDTLNTVGATYLKNGPKPKTTTQKSQRS